jgi:hypothetical protein
LSVLGKYRRGTGREEEQKTEDTGKAREIQRAGMEKKRETAVKQIEAVPNNERKSPIVSFSIPTDLRACLQAIRKDRSINLSMWVEKRLREAIVDEFPNIAEKYLDG